MNECIYLFISSLLHYMNIKHPCKKVELRARFVVVATNLVPDSPRRRLIAEYLSFQTAVGEGGGEQSFNVPAGYIIK